MPNPQSRTAKKAKEGPKRPVPTFDHLKAKQPVRVYHWVPMDDGTLSANVNRAKQALARAQLHQGSEQGQKLYAAAEETLEQAQAELREQSLRMVFQGIGQYAFEAMVAQHPATEEQKAEFQKQGAEAPYNPDTFAAPLIAAACVEPKMTVEEVQLLQTGRLYDEEGQELDPEDEDYLAPWNQAEFAELFRAALQASTSRRVADLGF